MHSESFGNRLIARLRRFATVLSRRPKSHIVSLRSKELRRLTAEADRVIAVLDLEEC